MKRWIYGTAVSVMMVSTGAWAQEAPNPSEVYINGISTGGTGCPNDSVSSYLSEDAKAFTLMFDKFVAQTGRGLAPTESRKFCNVNLDLHIPHGWQYTLFKVDYVGYAALARGDLGILSSTYRISGSSGRTNSVTFNSQVRGPINDTYMVNNDVGIVSDVWSACGISRALNIKTDVRVLARSPGLMTVDTIDGEFKTIYKIQWRRCR